MRFADTCAGTQAQDKLYNPFADSKMKLFFKKKAENKKNNVTRI